MTRLDKISHLRPEVANYIVFIIVEHYYSFVFLIPINFVTSSNYGIWREGKKRETNLLPSLPLSTLISSCWLILYVQY